MPLLPPALDDRSFDDLVEELLARIPAHTPEWTNPRLGDPGRTLIELFAWLGDTILYRANLIPERQRLAFLRLLGQHLRPAIPARGLVTVTVDDDKNTNAIYLQPGAVVKGPVNFETLSELTILPVSGQVYYKRTVEDSERRTMRDLLDGLKEVYQLDTLPNPYVTTPIFAGGAAETEGFDLIAKTVDKCLWIALLAPTRESVAAVKESLGKNEFGGRQLLNIGVAPAIKVPSLFEEISAPARVPHVWEISTGRVIRRAPEYLTLDVVHDSTAGLTRRGVVRLALPSKENIGALTNDVRQDFNAGLGDRPPRIDEPDAAARLVTWLRLKPTQRLQSFSLSWVGVNAIEIDQRQTSAGRIVGQSDGAADQQFFLGAQSVEPETLHIQVEEADRGFQTWHRISDLGLAGRDATVYSVDAEAGVISFGDGVRGRIPEPGARIRIALMRAGGGAEGNLPPGSLGDITGRDLRGNPVPPPKLKVTQGVATDGGEETETLVEAERRIPAFLRHCDRAVTEQDYKRLTIDAPGVRVGRVEVLPRFKPHQRRTGIPGVVSVMALPFKGALLPPNPRSDRPFIESVHNYLNARRPLATELYVIGCDYKPLGVSVGITIRDGFARDAALNGVREALRAFLWPLAPGGVEGEGWPLGRAVRDQELEVVAARVPGIREVLGVNLFSRSGDDWQMIPRSGDCGPSEMRLQLWELPELLSVVVVTDGRAPDNLRGVPNPFGDVGGVAVPVVPEVC